MGPGKLFWKLFVGNALLMTAALALLAWNIGTAMDNIRWEELRQHLMAQAATVREAVRDRFDWSHSAELTRFVRDLAAASPQSDRVRYTLILANGLVLADSEADPATMEPHGDRKEVRDALSAGWGMDVRTSHTTAADTRYVAIRVGTAEAPVGVVRTAMRMRTIGERTQAAHRDIWKVAIGGAGVVVLLALGLARMWSNPIRRITLTARSLSRGDLTARLRVRGNDELAMLGRSLNEMRDHLAQHVETIDRQRRTLESLLAQLHEGVVAAGPDGRIVLINPAAVRLLGLAASPARVKGPLEGLAVEQCIAQHELQQLLVKPRERLQAAIEGDEAAASKRVPQEVRLQINRPDGELTLLARAEDIVLPGAVRSDGRAPTGGPPVAGRLLVLTDITELTRALQVKADFAANASHELRTPLSAIRAAVETLAQLDPAADADRVRQFLSVVERHTERMQAMVADLLDLSRIESSPSQFRPTALNLRELFSDLQGRYNEPLLRKGLAWETDVPVATEKIVANPYLLRLVLGNLIDNAIKFTDSGGRICITSREALGDVPNGRSISIEVSDTGCGIPEDEQSRVFERFYQVERARSGALRGTGLGLSIVRHAVSAMRGTVALRSKLGEGTCVTVTIPQSAS